MRAKGSTREGITGKGTTSVVPYGRKNHRGFSR